VRIKETPWGAARFTYAYFAVVLAGVGAGLIAAIGIPIAGSLPVCKAESGGTCVAVYAGAFGLLGLFGFLFLVAFVFRLGWQWAAWVVVLTLVTAQIVIESSLAPLAWVALLIPALAALLTFERPDRDRSKRVRLAVVIALGVVGAQFLVWAVLLWVT
jgi:hypothetical protein